MEPAEGHKIKPKYTLISSTEGFISGWGIALYSGKRNWIRRNSRVWFPFSWVPAMVWHIGIEVAQRFPVSIFPCPSGLRHMAELLVWYKVKLKIKKRLCCPCVLEDTGRACHRWLRVKSTHSVRSCALGGNSINSEFQSMCAHVGVHWKPRKKESLLSLFLWELHQFAGVAITKYQRWDGYNNRNLFPCSSGDWKSKIKVLIGLSSETSLLGLWMAILPLCLPPLPVCIQIASSYKDTSHIGIKPPIISFNLNHLFLEAISK